MNVHRRIIGWITVCAVIALAISWHQSVRAIDYDQPFSLTISPYYLSLNTKPGHSTSDSITLKNNSSDPVTLQTGLMRFRSYNDRGVPELLPLEPNDQFANWISFSDDTFTIAAGGSKKVAITITVPENAALGYYYAVKFQKVAGGSTTDTTQLLGSSAVLLLLEVTTPNITKDVRLLSFTADKIIYDYLPVTFTVTLKNQGNIHIAPTGNIFIDHGNQKDVGIIDVNKVGGNILPDSTRAFTSIWDDGFPRHQEKIVDGTTIKDKKGATVYTLHWNWADASKVRIGKYTANLLLVYDNGTSDVPVQGVLSFWVIPWQIILGAGLILLFALFGLASLVKRLSWRSRPKKHRRLSNNNDH